MPSWSSGENEAALPTIMTNSEDIQSRFLVVIENNKGLIFKVANLYSKEPDDRKDLAQEIILQLWRSFASYNNSYKLSTFIYRIALNVAISFYRKETNRKKISNQVTANIFNVADFHTNDELKVNTSLLMQFISELKELDKALMLLYLEEKSYKEISEIIGITETNVATKIGRIKIILKQKFHI